jgi:hypothetical protein
MPLSYTAARTSGAVIVVMEILLRMFAGTATSVYHSTFTRMVALRTKSFYLNDNKKFLYI